MHKTNNHSFLALSATTEGAAPLDAAPSVVINKKYKNALEIKRHATSEGVDVDSAGIKVMMNQMIYLDFTKSKKILCLTIQNLVFP